MVSTLFMVDTSSHPGTQLHRCVEKSAYAKLNQMLIWINGPSTPKDVGATCDVSDPEIGAPSSVLFERRPL